MKKCIGRWCLPGDMTVTQVIEVLVEAGCGAVEWALDETGEISLASTESDFSKVREKCAAAGIEVASVATGLMWKYSLTDNDSALRAKGREVVRKEIDCAALLGADTVLVVPGRVSADVGYDTAWSRASEAIKELADYAAEKRVYIGIENVWNRFLVSPREMREFVDSIGSPWVGVYFDAGNILQYGIAEDWVRSLGSRILKVHVKGFKLDPGGWAGFVTLLAGDNDWPGLMAALREVGYKGHIVSEVSPLPEGALASARVLCRELDTILAM